MMHATRRRLGSPAWLGLGLVVALPNLAQAQLFPNRTITRQKADCASEPPFYSQVRRNFYGYYPTCWSRFPAGWGCPCPNPELPNVPAEFAKRERDKLVPREADPSLDGEGMGDDAAPPLGTAPGADAGIPPVPNNGRSPFNSELNPPDGAGRPPADSGLPPETGRPPAANNRTRPATPGLPEVNPSTTSLPDMPRVDPPAANSADATPSVEPVLNVSGVKVVPDATLTSAEVPARPVGPVPVVDSPLPPGPPVAGAPAQAPQRKSLLSNLFGGKRRR